MRDPVIERRTESWIAVSGETTAGTETHIELRPGADEGKVRLKSSSLFDTELDIAKLREGLDEIEQEHRR